MLNAIRKRATGWVVRIFLVLLILSFAVWGIGDVFRASGPTDVVAEVDGQPIQAQVVRREAELGFQQLQRQFGDVLPRDDGIMASLTQQALQGLISRRLIDAHARELGLTAADATLAARVRDEPAFQGAGGFDRSRFDMVLRSSGTDEAGFFQQLRMDLVRADIINAVTGIVAGSETAAKLIDAYRGEQRSGEVLIVATSSVPMPAPDDAALEAYLAAHPGEFALPEFRSVTLVTLAPEDLVGEVHVDDASVRAEYESRLDRYRTPERRRAVQLLAADQATADAAATALAGGQKLSEVASALADRGVGLVELGEVARGSLPDALEAAVFATEVGARSAPVQTDFGWHIVEVEAVLPEHTTPLAEVEASLRDELARRIAGDRLPQVATRLDDSLAAGTDLPAAAQQAGAQLRQMVVDRQGLDRAGAPPPGAPLPRGIVDEIFAARAQETSLLQTDENGNYYVFAVDSIEPSRPLSLAETRDKVTAAWQRDEQAKVAKATAERLRGEAAAGKPLAELAAATPGSRLAPVPALRRDAAPASLPLGERLQALLFSTGLGEVGERVVDVPAGYALLRVDQIIPAEAGGSTAATRDAVAEELRNDLAQSYEAALRRRYPVETNARALSAILPQPTSTN